MSEIENTLWNDYKTVSNQIKQTEMKSAEYSVLLEERDKIRNELIELEKANQEVDIKISQIECDNSKDLIRNIITLGTFGGNLLISWWTIRKTFKFDEVATITSTLGRGTLNGVIPKLGKR